MEIKKFIPLKETPSLPENHLKEVLYFIPLHIPQAQHGSTEVTADSFCPFFLSFTRHPASMSTEK